MKIEEGTIAGGQYHMVINKMLSAFARHRIILDSSGKPVDYVYEDVNEAFEHLMGVKRGDITGERVTKLFKDIDKDEVDWIALYGKVALSGESIRFEQYSRNLDKWYSVSAYSDEYGYFSTIFHDISEQKRIMKSLEILNRSILQQLDSPFAEIDYQKVVDNLATISEAKFTIINTYDSAEGKTTTRAISGVDELIVKASGIFGFKLIGQSWELDDLAKTMIQAKELLTFSSLSDLASDHIPLPIAYLIEKTCGIGQVHIIGISQKDELLGNLLMIMPKDKTLQNRDTVELFARQTGVVLLRKRAEEKLQRLASDYETILNGTQDFLISWNVDESGHCSLNRFNERVEELVGLSAARNSDEVMKRLSDPLAEPMLKEHFYHCIKAKKTVSFEAPVIVGEREITMHSVLTPIVSDGRVSGIVGSSRDVSERKLKEEEIRYLSFHDKTTGLYNKAFFEEELKRLESERLLPLSIIFGDVNSLKIINDVFGHDQGDRLLIQLANIVKRSCREEDIVARWGGDEFVIILPGTDERVASDICNRITALCESAEKEIVQPSISLGHAAKTRPEQNILLVIKQAEQMMYREKILNGKRTRRNVILSLDTSLHSKNFETEEHAKRMIRLARMTGEVLGMNKREREELELLCRFHDIGKINIPEKILTKKSKLTEDEWEVVRTHSETGYHITRSIDELTHIAECILSHHERWNGSGYPRGLKGLEIPRLARLLGVIDSYDNMIHSNHYRACISSQDAIREIERNAGVLYDPVMAEAFVKAMQD